jgi:hypothetical protein
MAMIITGIHVYTTAVDARNCMFAGLPRRAAVVVVDTARVDADVRWATIVDLPCRRPAAWPPSDC